MKAKMKRGDITRWLYRGQRPNWIARTLNRVWATVASTGVTSNIMETLEVTGRKSGRTVSLPIVLAVVDGQRYLVSMLGENVNWVQNVRAANGRAVLRSGAREEIQLEEVPADQRAPILKAYLQRAPGGRPHVPVDKDAPVADFEKVAAGFPVFRVVSRKKV
jgi:deazaflavin-dependent oxidoreductase (nitroreductase family)